jgi:mercuric ion transport protein
MVTTFTPVSFDDPPIVKPLAREVVIPRMTKTLAPIVTIGCTFLRMTIKDVQLGAGSQFGPQLMAAGGLLGALAASSCCILPLVLFGLGVSGAWIGNVTQLAPYQPAFIAATVSFLACGYWLVHRSSRIACADDAACARPLPNRLVKAGLIVATILVAAAVGVDLLAPLLLNS